MTHQQRDASLGAHERVDLIEGRDGRSSPAWAASQQQAAARGTSAGVSTQLRRSGSWRRERNLNDLYRDERCGQTTDRRRGSHDRALDGRPAAR